MSIIKSFSVSDNNGENGDMFYIQHGSNNFTIIDCCLSDQTKKNIVDEIIEKRTGKNITRVISTHPDEDHISGLEYLDSRINILNFYCVDNNATKSEESESFKHYCKLRDDTEKHYFVYAGCKRKWMNDSDDKDPNDNGSSGINFLWPITRNSDYIDALQKANEGREFNNISPVFTYSLRQGITAMWMGDMEHDFLEKIKGAIEWPSIDILFAPHHGRESGKVSSDILEKMDPSIIVIGEAPSQHLNYYAGYNTITQNSAKDIILHCESGKIHIYVSDPDYKVDVLENCYRENKSLGYYIGSLDTKEK